MSNHQDFNSYNSRKNKSANPADSEEFNIEFPDDEIEDDAEETPAQERELTEEEAYYLRRQRRRQKQEEQRRREQRRDRIFVLCAIVLIIVISIGVYKMVSPVVKRNAAVKTTAESSESDKETTEPVSIKESDSAAESTGNAAVSTESAAEAADSTASETAATDVPVTEDPAAQITNAPTKSHDPADSTDENGNWVPPYPTDITVPSWITQDYIDVNEKTRPGRALTSVDNIVVHYVGNPGSTAKANRDYFNEIPLHDDERGASAHFVVGFDGDIVQCVPLGEMAQANYPMNDYTISIETCHPDETGRFTENTYRTLIKLVAWLCEEYGLTADDVIRHYDVSGKLCPIYYCPNTVDNPYGHPEEWDRFREEVRFYMSTYPDIAATNP